MIDSLKVIVSASIVAVTANALASSTDKSVKVEDLFANVTDELTEEVNLAMSKKSSHDIVNQMFTELTMSMTKDNETIFASDAPPPAPPGEFGTQDSTNADGNTDGFCYLNCHSACHS